MTEREAWEVAFDAWKATWAISHTSHANIYEDGLEEGFEKGFEAAIAAQDKPGVPVALDPRWKWVGVDEDDEEWVYVDRPTYDGSIWRLDGSDDNRALISDPAGGGTVFAGLLPGRLYEIVDGRFVERESHT